MQMKDPVHFEICQDMMKKLTPDNPLLDFSGLPRFCRNKTPEQVAPGSGAVAGRKPRVGLRVCWLMLRRRPGIISCSRWTMPTSVCRVRGGRWGI